MNNFLIIDGNSLAHRSYHAYTVKDDIFNHDKIPNAVCYGVLNTILDLIAEFDVTAMVVCFDTPEPTFRHKQCGEYKGARKEIKFDFLMDILNLHKILDIMGIKQLSIKGWEADDLIGTLSELTSIANYHTYIVSGDRDLFQIVNDNKNISIIYLHTNRNRDANESFFVNYTENDIKEKMGILPKQIIDYKALCGDISDNISGVKGIGDKTALKLLTAHETLESIYDNLSFIKPNIKDKLVQYREDAVKSKTLATINLNVPLHEINLLDFKLKPFNLEKLIPTLDNIDLSAIHWKVRKLI